MTKKGELIVVNRNTAISMGGMLQQPACKLLDEQVTIGSYLLGFDPEGDAGEQLLYSAEDTATREANQHLEEPFFVSTWACKKVAVHDLKSGEDIPSVRTVLFDPKGETLAFVSIGALLSLDMLRARKGDGPYDPPIPVVIREVKTRAGWRLYKFLPVTALRRDNKAK